MTDVDDTDLLAAEYVLGTLSAAERRQVAARLPSDVALFEAVTAWEERLSPLSEATLDVSPPEAVYATLLSRLFGARIDDLNQSPVDLYRRLRRWRAAAAGLAALAAGLAGWIVVEGTIGRDSATGSRFTAVLQHDAASAAMVLDVDVKSRRLTIRPIGSNMPADKSYQLWIIDPAIGAPRSLGIVPAAVDTRTSLGDIDRAVITNATYAITIEPRGGSPNGKPSGSPVLSGKLVPTSP